jgi:hypothetical protein
MPEPALSGATYIGQVSAVRGGVVQVRLRDVPTTLVMVEGAAHRIGQIGAFVRIPLGYTQLYGVCTQVGADVLIGADDDDVALLEIEPNPALGGYRWMTVALFGEAAEGKFDRGVGQYPTVGDEVHLVTARDLDVIYSQRGQAADGIVVGRVAGSDALPAALRLSALVNRHACVVGSTGSGKSNLVAVLLRALAAGPFKSARVLVVDPHGEYASALPVEHTRRIAVGAAQDGNRLRVPYWALGFDELARIAMGGLSDRDAEHVRERVRELKVEAAKRLASSPNEQAITADSPIPFSIRRLWWELEDAERATFGDRAARPEDRCKRTSDGDPEGLVPPEYPPATSHNTPPFLNPQRRASVVSSSSCARDCSTPASRSCSTRRTSTTPVRTERPRKTSIPCSRIGWARRRRSRSSTSRRCRPRCSASWSARWFRWSTTRSSGGSILQSAASGNRCSS